MIQRAIIHVAGPPGAGKTSFVEHLLHGIDQEVLAARCRRDASRRHPREASPMTDRELRRYRAGAVVVEGDSPLEALDLRVYVSPPLSPGQALLVRKVRDRASEARDRAAAMERLLREPDGIVRFLTQRDRAPELLGLTAVPFSGRGARRDGYQLLAPRPQALSRERVVDLDAADLAAGLQVLSQEAGRTGTSGRLDDEGVPEGERVALLEFRGGQDERDVDLHGRPLAVERHDLASGGAAHGRLELPGRDDVELLQHLGAECPSPLPPQVVQQRLGDGLLAGLGAVVRVDQDIGVDEARLVVCHGGLISGHGARRAATSYPRGAPIPP